jgi:SAM-dependent methyltransferase
MLAIPLFLRSSDECRKERPPRVPWKYILEFLADGNTPLRVLNDCGIRALMPYIEGPEGGEIIELGGVDDYYKKFARPGQGYIVTNIDGGERRLDMTQINLPDNSVDAFLSVFALEHIYDFQRVVDECFRCLKPGGRLLLSVPFLCYLHAAPDDYFRFTDSALNKMLNRFLVLNKFSLGNRELLISMTYHEKAIMGSRHSRPIRALLRVMALPFLISGLAGNQHDRVYAIGHVYLCEKP